MVNPDPLVYNEGFSFRRFNDCHSEGLLQGRCYRVVMGIREGKQCWCPCDLDLIIKLSNEF